MIEMIHLEEISSVLLDEERESGGRTFDEAALHIRFTQKLGGILR